MYHTAVTLAITPLIPNKVAIEAPPLATYTIPSFRSRKHRGGESILLKHAYPSGFCQQTKSRHHYALSAAAAAVERRQKWPFSSTQGGLVSETKDIGVPKWGAASSKWIMNVTRVVVGAEVVDAGVGNDLVHFGPGFPCNPTEYLSPRRLSHRARPPSPLSPTRTTIDGSTLKQQDVITAACTELENDQPSKQLRRRSPPDSVRSPRCGQGNVYGQGERKRNREFTAERGHSADTSAQRPCSGENLVMTPSNHCTGLTVLHSPRSREAGVGDGGVAPETRGSVGDGSRTESGAEISAEHNSRPTHGQKFRGTDDERGTPPTRRYVDTDPQEPSSEPLRCSTGYKESLEGRTTVDIERSSHVSTTLPEVVQPVDTGIAGTGGVELALVDEQSGSLEEAWAVSGNNSSTFQVGSACPVASVTTLEGDCESSLSGSSADPLMAKRSLSSLDTERYGGTLSKDATEIVRSHLESQLLHPKEPTKAFLSGGHAVLSTDHAAVSPSAAPSTSRLQLLDSLLGSAGQTGQACPEAAILHPLLRPKGCYVRTRGDVTLAVVRRKQLLECKHDMGLRALKAAARPVCIKAGTPLAEGIRAVEASGVLLQAWAEEGSRSHQEERGPWGSTGSRGANGQSASLQYFDFRAGEWKAILSESDWKVMLAAPAGPQGAGVTFGFGGTNGRGADFLVAVAAAPRSPRAPVTNTKNPSAIVPWSSSRKLEGGTSRASADKKATWRFVARATPSDVIRSAVRVRRKHPTECLQDNSGHGLEGGDHEASDKKLLAALETGPQNITPDHSISSAISDDGSIRGVSYKAHEEQSPVLLGRQLAGLLEKGKKHGPGPGAAVLTSTTGRGGGCSVTRGPKKAKVRGLVKHLEARLRLKGEQGVGGLLGAPLLKIDMPYTKELAKWGYDEILGIPRVAVPGCGA